MRTVAVVPMNKLSLAKSRLASALDPENRRALVLWMGERVLRAILTSSRVASVAVVSPDPHVLKWALARNIEALHQTDGDLNEGLELGRRWAQSLNADTLVTLFGDLPLLSADDVIQLADAVGSWGSEARVALAPDRAGRGTNGVAMRPPAALPFVFGPESYSRYIEAARRAGVDIRTLRREGISFDVDTSTDLDDLRRLALWAPRSRDVAVSTPRGCA